MSLGAIWSHHCSYFKDFTKAFKNFAWISTDFARILRTLLEFLANQNFWGCACTPASYTSGLDKIAKSWISHCLYFIPTEAEQQLKSVVLHYFSLLTILCSELYTGKIV